MNRPAKLVPAGLAVAAMLALPATAAAKPQTGTVLKVDPAHRAIEIVSAKHVVRRYTAAPRLLKRARARTVVVYTTRGKRILKLRLKGRARKVSFYATVVASGKSGVTLRLADGRRVRIGAGKGRGKRPLGRVTAAAAVTVNIVGLKVGQVVMVTQTTDGAGNVNITLTLVQAPDQSAAGDDQTVTGTVTAVAADGSTLTVQVDGKGPMTFQTDSDLVDGVSAGDTVDVTYYQDTDGSLVADDVEPSGDNGSGSGSSGGDQDAIGTVTAVAADGSTLTVQVDGQGPMTFQTDPDMVDGLSVGDMVDVTYYLDTDGSFVADDVSPAGDSSGGGSGDSGSSGDNGGGGN